MKIAYIAHPVSGDVKGNIEKIIKIVREINLNEPEIVPFVPYLADLYALDDNNQIERVRGIKNDTFLLQKGFIDEVWLYGDRISYGMQQEIEFAESLNIPVVGMSKEISIILQKKHL